MVFYTHAAPSDFHGKTREDMSMCVAEVSMRTFNGDDPKTLSSPTERVAWNEHQGGSTGIDQGLSGGWVGRAGEGFCCRSAALFEYV